MLLNDEFYPTTSEVGFIELPLGDAAAALQAVMRPDTPLRPRSVEGRAGRHARLAPSALVATRSRWTAYFDNGWRGTDARLRVSRMALHAKCMGLRGGCSRRVPRSQAVDRLAGGDVGGVWARAESHPQQHAHPRRQ